jgi:hypothetical protein
MIALGPLGPGSADLAVPVAVGVFRGASRDNAAGTELPTRSQLTPRIASSTGAVPPATARLAPLAGLVVAAPAAT